MPKERLTRVRAEAEYMDVIGRLVDYDMRVRGADSLYIFSPSFVNLMIRLYEARWPLAAFLLAGIGALVVHPLAGLPFFGLFLFTLYFFRDPERELPEGENLIICPADGTVLEIVGFDDPHVGAGKRVAIFMSLFNVHVNRCPLKASIVSMEHTSGKKVIAYLKGELEARERLRTEFQGPIGYAVEQYAGIIARRIVSFVAIGDELGTGDKIGMIRYGSRVDIILPEGVSIDVEVGQKVTAGQTVIGGYDA